MYQPALQQQRLKNETQQLNGDGESKKKKKKKPFDPFKPKKQLSKVWKAFRDSPDGAYCNYCGALRKRNDSSTKSLWEHLKQKHVDILKTLKGENEGSNVPASANISSNSSKSANQIGTDLQNVCSSLLQSGNTYDASSNSFNLMATLQGATAPSHQLLSGFGLAPNGTSGDARHNNVFDLLAAGSAPGVRQGTTNMFSHVGRSMPSRPVLLQSQSQMISLVRWRVEPVSSKESIGINFILRGIRTDNNTNYTSSELQMDMGNGTYKTMTGDHIQLSGPMENDNKDPFRNGIQNWFQYAMQQLLRTFK